MDLRDKCNKANVQYTNEAIKTSWPVFEGLTGGLEWPRFIIVITLNCNYTKQLHYN